MRRAISPATCTQVTSRPSRVRSQSALRSFSSDALSSAALTNAPGKYQRSFTVPSTGERFECTLKTFMNTLTLSASRSSYGSRALPTSTMRPSAGESTARGSSGTVARRIAEELQDEERDEPERQPTTSQPKQTDDRDHDAIARNGQPSRAMTDADSGTSPSRRAIDADGAVDALRPCGFRLRLPSPRIR